MKKTILTIIGIATLISSNAVISKEVSSIEGQQLSLSKDKIATTPSVIFTTNQDSKVIIQVDGISWSQIKSVSWNNEDIYSELLQDLKNGVVKIQTTPTGFELIAEYFALSGRLTDNGTFTMTLSTGMTLSTNAVIDNVTTTAKKAKAAAASCAWLTFAAPAKTSEYSNCGYGSTSCAVAGAYHTGIDYYYSASYPDAYAAANGKVVRVEYKSGSDHGMGNNVIVEHTLQDCSKIYTSYSHLYVVAGNISVGTVVSRGQRIGTIGGSGYGNGSYWGKHLHFEVKMKPVTSNPWGYKGACNSRGDYTCWGYMKSYPDNYGYKPPHHYY